MKEDLLNPTSDRLLDHLYTFLPDATDIGPNFQARDRDGHAVVCAKCVTWGIA